MANATYIEVMPDGTPYFTTQPQSPTTVTEGSISGTLTAAAAATTGTPGYAWYMCDDVNGANEQHLGYAQTESFTIPTGLTQGTHYFFCRARNGGLTADSSIATVTVLLPPAPPAPPSSTSSSFAMGGSAYTGASYMGTMQGDSITVQADCSKFTSVTLDGVQLTKDKDYTVTCGSTIITFTPEYLATLTDGAHSLRVQFTDGQYTGTVSAPLGTAVTAVANVPATGGAPFAWTALVAALGLRAAAKRRRKA